MPTYDYKCTACGHTFELFQPMSERPKRKCPKCGKGALERLIGTGAAVVFKGSGFYQTDYRSESYKKAAEAEKPSTSSTDTSGKGEQKKTADTTAASGADSSKAPATKKTAKPKKGAPDS